MTCTEHFEPDDTHPIPDLDAVDVHAVKSGGGSDLFIIIAAPMQPDRRSLERLLRKIEVCLQFIHGALFQDTSGVATPANTNIIVRIHPESHPTVFELLERNKPWVSANGATLIVDSNPLSGH